MASYVGTYINDFGVLFQMARLSVYAVVAEVRQNTREDTDATYLPAVFSAAVSANERNACEIEQGGRILRHARAWFRSDAYLVIPCPWRGDAPEFVQFHQALIDNANVLHVEHVGEHVNAWYSQVFSG